MSPGPHLLAAPVLLPLATAAVLLAVGERWRGAKAALSLASLLASLVLACGLLAWAQGAAVPAVYLPGNWPVPFGIVLVLDGLSAGMLVLAASTALAGLLFSLARWHRAGVHFHPLLQLQLAGLNGAFLTGDLFNLFVFFEVLLAASYALLLHGGGTSRVRPGLHYIAVNLVASFLFLMGVALLYGVTGTLNMADIARKLPLVPLEDRGLLHAAAALLAVAFLAKAGFWPLNFWLPRAYAAASAPSAAVFTTLTKVGVYAVLRLWTLCFPTSADFSAHFGGGLLVWGGLATLAFGAIGMLRSQQLGRVAGYSIISSSGTVVAAAGLDTPALTAGALVYLASSTLGAAALFLLAELVERRRQAEVDPPRADTGGRLPRFGEASPIDANLDDRQVPLVGRAIPASLALLATAFLLCTLVVAGMPPLSGFVGKLAMLRAITEARFAPAPQFAAWLLFALLIFSSFTGSVALLRAFSTHFWASYQRTPATLRIAEMLPVGLLLAACIALAAGGERVLAFTAGVAAALHAPDRYVQTVFEAQPVPSPTGSRP
ncbi:monovalent cation/H+ antiporter subunit D [Ramlibacter sp. USB13]|uniref:Monovalent cation/H+ antiporter subunit D n=1 Tax=Ramlibacter cellulosilyticus TaxID=2764187 RepID=A0A923MT90_9BURK|nr:monovalent cation/H+ antiporter subunit D [Ramlibacter cellulosilyticus]MBC5784596.1 monovalent cation/H+ antiporter subunit D [Ramlibacter cellulosilyticus]